MKSQIPRCVPRIFPLVGHRDDVTVQHMKPLGVASALLTRSRQGMSCVLFQPAVQVEVVVLLAPQHTGQGLAVYATFILAQRARSNSVIEFVGIGKASSEYVIKRTEWISWWFRTQSKPDDLAAPGGDFQAIVRGRLRACLGGIHSVLIA